MPSSCKQSVKLFGPPSGHELSFAQKQKVAEAGFKIHKSEVCYHVLGLSETDSRLESILEAKSRESGLDESSSSPSSSSSSSTFVVEVGPRQQFTSAQSTHSVSIAQACGLSSVERIERTKRFLVSSATRGESASTSSTSSSSSKAEAFASLVHDRMTECVYSLESSDGAGTIFDHGTSTTSGATPSPTSSSSCSAVKRIPVSSSSTEAAGISALEEFSKQNGLGFDADDIAYYHKLFAEELKRDPTDVELFDLAQGNSEHSRHWFFGGKMVIDGEEQEKTLFQMVKNAYKLKEALPPEQNSSTIAFEDNSSAQRGSEVTIPLPAASGTYPGPYKREQQDLDITLTAETHNFPCGIAPLPGAETGSGGRMRDNHSTGRGAYVQAGVAGYCVGNLSIPGYVQPHEGALLEEAGYPANMAKPLDILISASNGASDYGNKFGEPLVAGFTRSFGTIIQLQESTSTEGDSVDSTKPERVEWIKPIMFSGGLGRMLHSHVEKKTPQKGNLIVKIGGPAYRIGVGGGAASSMVAGDNKVELDFNAVQRADAEMERKCECVIRACLELGDKNPILSIHDQGAGGSGNVLKEICDPAGAKIDLSKMLCGDKSMTALELWVAEFQENDCLLLDARHLPLFEKICEREKLPFAVVGEVTGDGQVEVGYAGEKIVDLPLEKVLGKMPQKTFHTERMAPRFSKHQALPEDLTIPKALDQILRLVSVCSKRFLTNKVDRSVTGLVVQQQCVGPLHTPLADCAVVAHSPLSNHGAAVSIGEQPLKGLSGDIVDLQRQAKLTVAEAVLNMIGVQISSLEDVRASGNWMWPAKFEGEGAKMYEVCQSLCECIEFLGFAIDGGKDSLSMATRTKEHGVVKCPGEVVLTCYARVPDVRCRITPEFKRAGSRILFVDFSPSSGSEETCRELPSEQLAGTALAQICNLQTKGAPDVDLDKLKRVWKKFQQSYIFDRVLAVHDVSDGGFVVALLEMCFAGNLGADISAPGIRSAKPSVALPKLFRESPGLILEVAEGADAAIVAEALGAVTVGRVLSDDVVAVANDRGEELLAPTSMKQLRDTWEATSFELEKQQVALECLTQERMGLLVREGPTALFESSGEQLFSEGSALKAEMEQDLKERFSGGSTSSSFSSTTTFSNKIPLAVLREEGSNGEREMSWALEAAGFEPWDVTMTDLEKGVVKLEQFRGLIFVGGFSFADTLGSAAGWAAKIKYNVGLKKQFDDFRAREDSFSLGICNGCQLMSQLGWLGDDVRLKQNASGRFESRFVAVKCEESASMWLKGLAGATLGVWVSHGEGRFDFGGSLGGSCCETAFSYVDDSGKPTTQYPMNPNGSPDGIAGCCSKDGRHLAFMPHPERSYLTWQIPLYDGMPEIEVGEMSFTPWIRLFQNAYNWCASSTAASFASVLADASCAVSEDGQSSSNKGSSGERSLSQLVSASDLPSPSKRSKRGLQASPIKKATGRARLPTTNMQRLYSMTVQHPPDTTSLPVKSTSSSSTTSTSTTSSASTQPPVLLRLGVLLSGSGSTLQNILDHVADGSLPNCIVKTVVSSRKDAYGITRAEKAGIPVQVVESRKFKKKEDITATTSTGSGSEVDWSAMSQAVTSALGDVDVVVLAGFMCKYEVPTKYANRVINVHPSLLPEFGGQGMYGDHVHEAVLKAGAAKSGCTVHIVTNDGYDKGPILLQKELSLKRSDNITEVTALRESVQALERQALIDVLKSFCKIGVATGVRNALSHEGVLIDETGAAGADAKAIMTTTEKPTMKPIVSSQQSKSTVDASTSEAESSFISTTTGGAGVHAGAVNLVTDDRPKHECGIALIRLLKPPEYYQKKYGTDKVGVDLMYVCLEKQRNRGQDGAGVACVRSDCHPGESYVDVCKSNAKNAIEDLFDNKVPAARGKKAFQGEVYLGHVRYGTFGNNSIDDLHPFVRESNWRSKCALLAGNFNLTNSDWLFDRLVEAGQHPKAKSDTVTCLEIIGQALDAENNRKYVSFSSQGHLPRKCQELVEENLDLKKILSEAACDWDGGFAMVGVLGTGDAFAIRDRHGIRPCFHWCDDEFLVVTSERGVIASAFNVSDHSKIHELTPGSALIIRGGEDANYTEQQILQAETPSKCVFERIYFSRANDPDIYRERLALGRQLAMPVLEILGEEWKNSILTFVPNTAEIALNGLSTEINKEKLIPIEKLIFKDAKLRTFISQDAGRNQLASNAYELTPGIVIPGVTTLVALDDSIVRGTTLRMSMIPRFDNLKPKQILFLSSAPQIRYPDCYGIDLSRLDNLVAFRAAVELLKERNMEHVLHETYEKCIQTLRSSPPDARAQNWMKDSLPNHVKAIYAPFTEEEVSAKISELVVDAEKVKTPVRILYQSVEGMKRAIPHFTGDWVFTGDFPTMGGTLCALQAFANFYEGSTARSYGRSGELEAVVVIGSGGREHALAVKLAQSHQVRRVYMVPGNGGGGRKIKNAAHVALNAGNKFEELREFCKEKKVSLVAVGPEQPLVDGIADILRADGVAVFGPSKDAVILEESKAFSKDFMRRHDIPTADYAIFRRPSASTPPSEGHAAGLEYIDKNWPVVVKASGLAAGKGAIVPKTKQEAKTAFTGMLVNGDFGAAADEVVLETRLSGRELSVLALSDGKTVKILPLAQDHKRAYDNDEGPNTGGMGAFAPVTDVSQELLEWIKVHCLQKCIDGMAAEGRPFVGVLFAGLMLSEDPDGTIGREVNVLEYNCRFGDPETQAVMPLLEGDLYQALSFCCKGKLDQVHLPVLKGFCVAVVLASGGYPGSYEKGKKICGLEKLNTMPSLQAFHAGTTKKANEGGSPATAEIRTSGGRVAAISAVGRTLEHATRLAYLGVEQVSFEGCFYRTDIAGVFRPEEFTHSPLHCEHNAAFVLRTIGGGVASPDEENKTSGGSSASWSSIEDLDELSDVPATGLEGNLQLVDHPPTKTPQKNTGASQNNLNKTKKPLTYKAAGVDIAAGNATVDAIKPFLRGTARPGCSFGEELSFGGFCDLAKLKYKDPVLVSGTDGVGTKLLVATSLDKHDTVGIDLVAMCVNDCLVHGAEPVFFLDYFATGKLTVQQAVDVVKGVTVGCRQANCALIGGETAEMPGLYKPGDYDIAGFSVGIVERSKILPKTDSLVAGTKILGLASSGVHSNGLSLARRIVTSAVNPETRESYTFLDPAPFDAEKSIGDYLLTPTRIYIRSLLPVMQSGKVLAAAHITGGGLLENIPRVLPSDVGAVLKAGSWPLPPILKWLYTEGNLDPMEMARTFNCGIGMAIFVKAEDADEVAASLRQAGEDVFEIGSLESPPSTTRTTTSTSSPEPAQLQRTRSSSKNTATVVGGEVCLLDTELAWGSNAFAPPGRTQS
ncbi:unnamed protein product [Amoebophrya sp. A25]|nr:unnamed protein product [Amoebophrya sp. A25]|eukprot:GSA25T00004010001.1